MYSCFSDWVTTRIKCSGYSEIQGRIFFHFFCVRTCTNSFQTRWNGVFSSFQCSEQVQCKLCLKKKTTTFSPRNEFIIKAIVYHLFSYKQLQTNPGSMWLMVEDLSVELALHVLDFLGYICYITIKHLSTLRPFFEYGMIILYSIMC